MMKKIAFILLLTFSYHFSYAQEIAAYKLYDKKGKEIKFKKLLAEFQGADIVLLGELHNNPVSHWMHLEILKKLQDAGAELSFGAEMLESDQQILIDEYIQGLIREKDLLDQGRFWPNHKTDYMPFIEFAAKNDIPVVATNVPRRYAAALARKGPEYLEQFSKEALKFLPPLPFPFDPEAPEYAQMIESMAGHGEMSGENMAKAQALKDAAMAHFILKNRGGNRLFIHVQGDYHSANYGGIFRYLKEYDPEVNVATFSTVSNENGTWKSEFEGRADFILVVTSNMTSTH